MELIDTHSHIYLPHFDNDRNEVILRARQNNVKYILLPNIDSGSIIPLHNLCDKFPGFCFPMMGLHPTSIDKNFENELEIITDALEKRKYVAIGECGIDLYWDKTFFRQQQEAFRYQITLAKKHSLPLIIHARESFIEILEILEKEWEPGLTGVFHSFTGTINEINRIRHLKFYFGIGGIVTFKNSDLQKIIHEIDLTEIVLETDSPYLAPAPKRGKRNESSYISYIAEKIAEILKINVEEIAGQTTRNALNLFNPA